MCGGRGGRGHRVGSPARQSTIACSGHLPVCAQHLCARHARRPPHDRLVWLSDNLRELLWCNPNKNKTKNLKPEARLAVTEVSAVVDGIKTETFKGATKGRDHTPADDEAKPSAVIHAAAKMSAKSSFTQARHRPAFLSWPPRGQAPMVRCAKLRAECGEEGGAKGWEVGQREVCLGTAARDLSVPP